MYLSQNPSILQNIQTGMCLALDLLVLMNLRQSLQNTHNHNGMYQAQRMVQRLLLLIARPIDTVGRSSNSGPPISANNRVGDGIDLEGNKRPNGEIQYIRLQATRQRTNSFPHNWPHRPSYQGLEEPKLSQTGERNLDAEESRNDHDSNSINTKSANERAWEMAFESQEKTYESEMAELREGHQEEIATLKSEKQDEAKAADSKKLVLQKRIKRLTQEKAKLQGELESQAATIQEATSAAQESQTKCDELEQQHRCLEQQLGEAAEEIRVLTAGLRKNQIFAFQARDRSLELQSALSASPNEVANTRGVIELKDHMFSDTETKATECFEALMELKKTSDREKVLATRKIAMLKVMLELSEKSNAGLQESKSNFQRSAEEVLAMLQRKVFPTDLTAALEYHFNVAIQDNEGLTTLVSLQKDELSGLDTKVVSLESEIRGLEKASAKKDQRVADLEDQVRKDNLEIGRLEIELESVRAGMRHKVVQTRLAKQEINALKQDLKAASDENLELLKVGLDERGLTYANFQAQECERLSSANQKLEEDLYWSENVAGQNAAQIEHIESEMAKAEVVIKTLQGQINGQLGLPANACVAELVLICRTAIDRVAEEPRPREVEPDDDDTFFSEEPRPREAEPDDDDDMFF